MKAFLTNGQWIASILLLLVLFRWDLPSSQGFVAGQSAPPPPPTGPPGPPGPGGAAPPPPPGSAPAGSAPPGSAPPTPPPAGSAGGSPPGANDICKVDPVMSLGFDLTVAANYDSFVGIIAVCPRGEGMFWVDQGNNVYYTGWTGSPSCPKQKVIAAGTTDTVTGLYFTGSELFVAAPPYIWRYLMANRTLIKFAGPFSTSFSNMVVSYTLSAIGFPFLLLADTAGGCIRAIYTSGNFDNVGGCGGDTRNLQLTSPISVLIPQVSTTITNAYVIESDGTVWLINVDRTGSKSTNTLTTIAGYAATPLSLSKLPEQRYAYGIASTNLGTCSLFRLDISTWTTTQLISLGCPPSRLSKLQLGYLENGTVVYPMTMTASPKPPTVAFSFDCSISSGTFSFAAYSNPNQCAALPPTTLAPTTTAVPTAAPIGNSQKQQQSSSDTTQGIIIGVSVGAVVLVIILAVIGCLLMRRSAKVVPASESELGTVEYRSTLNSTTNSRLGMSGTAPMEGGVEDATRGTLLVTSVSSGKTGHSSPPSSANTSLLRDDSATATLTMSKVSVGVSQTLPSQRTPAANKDLSHGSKAVHSFASTEDAVEDLETMQKGLYSDGSMAIADHEFVEERKLIRSGDFSKVKLLGRGAYGSVYSCLLGNGRTIAMKEMMLSNEDFQTIVSDVEREVEVMREIQHPNVVQYISARCDPAHCQITVFMELVTGGSLGSMVRGMKGASLSERTIQRLMKQAVTGLAYIHSKGIIHRDLKGDNMLLSSEGVVKLADFGTAKSVGVGAGASRGAQTMIGTPYYMAPELLIEGDNGEIAYGIKADVWSLGITVGELLNGGTPPWPAFSNPGQAFLHIATPGNLPILPETVSEPARAFVMYCCIRNPAERPTSAMLLTHPWLADI